MTTIADLFNVQRGNCDGIETYEKGTVPFVAAGTDNTGVVAFVKGCKKDKLFTSVPCLTVPAVGQGGAMFVSVQTGNFYATKNVAVLIPKETPIWGSNKYDLLISISAFLRKQRWRYYYMRPCGSRLGDLRLDMDTIRAVANQIGHTKPKIKTITKSDVEALLAKLPKGASVQDIFELCETKSLPAEGAKDSGVTPLVSTTERNNGIAGFLNITDPDYLVPSGGVSVAKNGRPMVSRVQMNPYVKTSDMAPLIVKSGHSFTERDLAILAALIETQAWRYHYLRKANWSRLGPQVIT